MSRRWHSSYNESSIQKGVEWARISTPLRASPSDENAQSSAPRMSSDDASQVFSLRIHDVALPPDETEAELFEIINSRIRPMPEVAGVESFPYFDIRTQRPARLFVQGKADFQRHLPIAYLSVLDPSAGLGHLKPSHVADGLFSTRQRILYRLLNPVRR